MRALIDTSVLVAAHALEGVELDDWIVSVITVGELHAGVLLARDAETRARRLKLLGGVLSAAPALPVDSLVAVRFGELREAAGRRPSNDLWIAATALAHDLTLVTADDAMASLPLVSVVYVTG